MAAESDERRPDVGLEVEHLLPGRGQGGAALLKGLLQLDAVGAEVPRVYAVNDGHCSSAPLAHARARPVRLTFVW